MSSGLPTHLLLEGKVMTHFYLCLPSPGTNVQKEPEWLSEGESGSGCFAWLWGAGTDLSCQTQKGRHHDKDPGGLLGTEGRGMVRAQEGMLSIRKGTGTPGSLLHVRCFIRVPGAQAFLLFRPGNRHEMLHFCSSEISSRGKLTLSASLLYWGRDSDWSSLGQVSPWSNRLCPSAAGGREVRLT